MRLDLNLVDGGDTSGDNIPTHADNLVALTPESVANATTSQSGNPAPTPSNSTPAPTPTPTPTKATAIALTATWTRSKKMEQDWINRPGTKAEADAAGMTPQQYVDSRGGIGTNGYWADSFVQGFTGQDVATQREWLKAHPESINPSTGMWVGGKSVNGNIARVDGSAALTGTYWDPAKQSAASQAGLVVKGGPTYNKTTGKFENVIVWDAPIGDPTQPFMQADSPYNNLKDWWVGTKQYNSMLDNWYQVAKGYGVGQSDLQALKDQYASGKWDPQNPPDWWQFLNSINPDLPATDPGGTLPGGVQGMSFDNAASTFGQGGAYLAGSSGSKNVTNTATSPGFGTSTSSNNPNFNPDLTLVSTSTDPKTNAVIGYFSDGSSKTLTPGALSQVETDAYALLEDTFKNYGLDTLVPVIEGYMKANLGSQQAALQLKQSKEYQTRFAGNQLRLANGQNVLPESDYLALENKYNEVLTQYGLKDYFGADRTTQIANMAKVIGADVNAPEFATRVSTVVDRVLNADPNIMATLKQFYNITNADLVNYYLDPSKENLATLQQKTTAAEIGTAATEQGLTTSVSSATALAQAGINQATAQKGYATIGQIVPEAQKLSSIYGEAKIGYDQATAESEIFNTTGAASAARKRRQLADLEAQAFQAKSGINQQVNPLGKGLQGSF
jgi:hypothetical protein